MLFTLAVHVIELPRKTVLGEQVTVMLVSSPALSVNIICACETEPLAVK
jgi:hypothetical protein